MHILLQRRCLRPAAARRCSNMTHFHLVRRASWFPNSKQWVLVCKLAVHAANRLPNRCHPTERNVAVSWPQEQNKASFGAQKRGHVFDTVLNAGPLGGPIFGSGFRPQKRDRKMQKKGTRLSLQLGGMWRKVVRLVPQQATRRLWHAAFRQDMAAVVL